MKVFALTLVVITITKVQAMTECAFLAVETVVASFFTERVQ